MATIRELMQQNHNKKLADLLDKFKNPQKFADGGTVQDETDDIPAISEGELKKLVQRDVDSPPTSGEAEDLIKALGLPPDHPATDGVTVGESYLPPDATRKYQLDDLINQTKTKNAVARNPVGEVQSGTTVGESYTPSNNLPAVKGDQSVLDPNAKNPEPIEDPGTDVAIKKGEASEMNGLSPGGMVAGMTNSAGAGLGMQALAQSQHDPDSAVSRLEAIRDHKPGVQPTPLSPEMLGIGNPNSTPRPDYMSVEPPNKILGPYDPNRPTPEQAPTDSSSMSSSANATAPEAPKSPLQALLDAYKGTQDTHAADLKDAQARANKNEFFGNLLKGVNQFNSGVTGLGTHGIAGPASVTAGNSQLDDILKSAQSPVTQYKETTENEKNDPNSQYSKGLQAFIAPTFAKLGIQNVPENMSAATLEKIAPFATKMYDQQLKSEYNMQAAQLRAQVTANKQSTTAGTQTDNRFDKANKLISEDIASSRSAFGKDATNINTIQNAKALLSGGDLDSLDNRQVVEAARVLDRVLSGGNSTISGTEHLTPETARMKIADAMEYVKNQRQGAGAASFLQNIQHTFDREEALAKSRIANSSQAILGSSLDLADKNPQKWDEMMAQHNLQDVLGTQALAARRVNGGLKNLTQPVIQTNPTQPQVNPSQSNSDIVKVVSPTGQTGSIPRSKLDAAKARGFKEVQ